MFYDNFNKLCEKTGTSPTAFTRDVLGLSTSKVTAWKNGSIPKYEILQQIADAFGVSVGELFDGENYSNEPYDMKPDFSQKKKQFRMKGAVRIIPSQKNTPDEEVRSIVIEKVNNLSNSQLDRLLGYIEALSEDINN